MTDIQLYLLSNQDEKYKSFTAPLIPNIDKETIIGVRLPIIKKYAKSLDENAKETFLNSLPHLYHEENILHSLILSGIKDYDIFISEIDKFLPYANNWAVCDTICNKYLSKHKKELIKEIYKWFESQNNYRVRYAIKCLMNYYLGEDFDEEHLNRVKEIKLEDYYVKMMISWYLATGLAKNYEQFIGVIESHQFDIFINNKTIQKAIESYRVSDEHKAYLRTLKVK